MGRLQHPVGTEELEVYLPGELCSNAFTPEVASAFLQLRAGSELEAHIEVLRRKANEGSLTRLRKPSTRIL